MPLSFLKNCPSDIVLLKFNDADLESVNTPSQIDIHELKEQKSEVESLKKERSKERIIFRVIETVKKWREIHLGKDNLRRVSLQEAAKLIGLPKKSLDDYYYQLRLGEKYGFAFK